MDSTEEGILYFHSRGIQPPQSGLFGIPENLKTFDLCNIAVIKNNLAFKYVPDRLKTYKWCFE